MKQLILLFSLLAPFFTALSQESSDIFSQVTTPSGGGNVKIHQDAYVKQLIISHVEDNGRSESMEGFRIQLYSGSSKKAKSDALSAKMKFLSIFPDIPVYLEYNAPFWRVRAGDFRSKNESMELYSKLKSFFPESYPVKDNGVMYTRIAEPLQ